jgi:hypothetical protein
MIEKMCYERNLGLALFDKIFILQNQKFVLESMLIENEKKSIYNQNLEDNKRIEKAINDLELDLRREKKKYSILFQKDYKYYF